MPNAEPRRVAGPIWLRLPGEVTACPACGSSRITLIDVLPVPVTHSGHRVAFVAGCQGCGLLFVNPPPRADDLDRYYAHDGPWAARRAERTSVTAASNARWLRKRPGPKALRPKARALFDALAPYVPIYTPPPGAKVLDFGCGHGKFLNRVQGLGWDTYGIEPSTGAAFPRHTRLEAPPQDGSFDFVVLHHVLEHVDAPLDLLSRLAGALRAGGVLFVSVPRLDTLPVHHDRDYCISGRRHVMSFSETCLRGLLARAGFAVAALLDAPKLDEAFTGGLPLRLRLVAERTNAPQAQPANPLDAALNAWRGDMSARGWLPAAAWRLVPVRLRGGSLDRALTRRVRRRQQSPGHESADPESVQQP